MNAFNCQRNTKLRTITINKISESWNLLTDFDFNGHCFLSDVILLLAVGFLYLTFKVALLLSKSTVTSMSPKRSDNDILFPWITSQCAAKLSTSFP